MWAPGVFSVLILTYKQLKLFYFLFRHVTVISVFSHALCQSLHYFFFIVFSYNLWTSPDQRNSQHKNFYLCDPMRALDIVTNQKMYQFCIFRVFFCQICYGWIYPLIGFVVPLDASFYCYIYKTKHRIWEYTITLSQMTNKWKENYF